MKRELLYFFSQAYASEPPTARTCSWLGVMIMLWIAMAHGISVLFFTPVKSSKVLF